MTTQLVLFRILIFVSFLAGSPAAMAFHLDTSPTTPTNVTGLWWNPAESGWGANITQQSNIIFVTINTYDAASNPIWYVAPNCAVLEAGCSGDLYKASGGHTLTTPWSGANVTVTKVGILTLVFTDNNYGSMLLTIDGVSGSKFITRLTFAGTPLPPPVSDSGLAKTQLLIGGTWTLSNANPLNPTDSASLTSVEYANEIPGDYIAIGTDGSRKRAIGGYDSLMEGFWLWTASGFYTFTFSDNNHISGCNYPTPTSYDCHTMTGTRLSP